MIERSYREFRHPEVTPVVSVGGLHVSGTVPRADAGLQGCGPSVPRAAFRVHAGTGPESELNILAATSGDTGSAAICGVRGRERMRIFVMHPHGRISPIQERQMTTVLDANVFNIAVEGTFDDCQRIMKTIFGDLDFKDQYRAGHRSTPSTGRGVLAQVVYYFYAAFRVMDATGAARVRFAVPTGQFRRYFRRAISPRGWDLPIGRLVLATNENDILARFFNSGEYSIGPVHETISPSMDIQVASNFERYLYYRVGEDSQRLSDLMTQFSATGGLTQALGTEGRVDDLIVAGSGDTAGTLATIREFHEEYGYLLDPHSAVGVWVGQPLPMNAAPMICLATAHPAKFGETIREPRARTWAAIDP